MIYRLDPILALRRAPAAWRGGRTPEIVLESPMLRMAGFVTVDLIHARTGLIKRHLEFRNLVVDAGLNALGAGSLTLGNFLTAGYCAVGTGSTAPANGDTGLAAETGVRTNSNGTIADVTGSGTSYTYWYLRITRLFTETQSNGNLTEFGLFSASTAGTMLARQLFKDGSGNPTTVVKTSADQLRITYEFRIYPPTVDATGTVVISGTSVNYTSRAANLTLASAWGSGGSTGYLQKFGATNSVGCTAMNSTAIGTTSASGPSGSTQSAPSDTTTITGYVAGSFYREITWVWNATSANFTGGSGGVSGFTFMPFGNSNSITQQAQFNVPLVKDNTKKLTLVWRFPFGRYP